MDFGRILIARSAAGTPIRDAGGSPADAPQGAAAPEWDPNPTKTEAEENPNLTKTEAEEDPNLTRS
ncbi:MAG: hypothetical protein IJ581_03150 [Paludibacteraceae bacterium]|nr:hypothetical protein [Paludibacteraceae bacterium]